MRLGYYIPTFPFPQGPSAGPYPEFLVRNLTLPAAVPMSKARRGHRHASSSKCGRCAFHAKCSPALSGVCGLRGLGQADAIDPATGIPYSDEAIMNLPSPGTAVLATQGYTPSPQSINPVTGAPINQYTVFVPPPIFGGGGSAASPTAAASVTAPSTWPWYYWAIGGAGVLALLVVGKQL